MPRFGAALYFTGKSYEAAAQRRRTAIVTDCRSLWDFLVKELANLADRRLSFGSSHPATGRRPLRDQVGQV